ncbi:hypothetical protein BaRGS_00016702 [Batillaria attramentaria]|uniref:Uncharacterized protein n=1 Tax=Batillaria attramentaria TaxID=370345 RepID=A0ABD0KXL9_9CAEN
MASKEQEVPMKDTKLVKTDKTVSVVQFHNSIRENKTFDNAIEPMEKVVSKEFNESYRLPNIQKNEREDNADLSWDREWWHENRGDCLEYGGHGTLAKSTLSRCWKNDSSASVSVHVGDIEKEDKVLGKVKRSLYVKCEYSGQSIQTQVQFPCGHNMGSQTAVRVAETESTLLQGHHYSVLWPDSGGSCLDESALSGITNMEDTDVQKTGKEKVERKEENGEITKPEENNLLAQTSAETSTSHKADVNVDMNEQNAAATVPYIDLTGAVDKRCCPSASAVCVKCVQESAEGTTLDAPGTKPDPAKKPSRPTLHHEAHLEKEKEDLKRAKSVPDLRPGMTQVDDLENGRIVVFGNVHQTTEIPKAKSMPAKLSLSLHGNYLKENGIHQSQNLLVTPFRNAPDVHKADVGHRKEHSSPVSDEDVPSQSKNLEDFGKVENGHDELDAKTGFVQDVPENIQCSSASLDKESSGSLKDGSEFPKGKPEASKMHKSKCVSTDNGQVKSVSSLNVIVVKETLDAEKETLAEVSVEQPSGLVKGSPKAKGCNYAILSGDDCSKVTNANDYEEDPNFTQDATDAQVEGDATERKKCTIASGSKGSVSKLEATDLENEDCFTATCIFYTEKEDDILIPTSAPESLRDVSHITKELSFRSTSFVEDKQFCRKEPSNDESSQDAQSNLSAEREVRFRPERNKRLRAAETSTVFSGLSRLYSSLLTKPDENFDERLPKEKALDYVTSAARSFSVIIQSKPFRLDLVFMDERYEVWRLSTFYLLDDLPVSAIRLAQSGFYYAQDRDDILCFSCRLSKRNWTKDEHQVYLVHLNLSPHCDHANFRDKKNVPIDDHPLLPDAASRQTAEEMSQVPRSGDSVETENQIQVSDEFEADGSGIVRKGENFHALETSASAPRQATTFSTAVGRAHSERTCSVKAGNLSLPTLPQDLELIAKHREYAAQSAGTAAPSSSVSPNLSKSGVVLGTDNASSLVSNNSVTFTTSQVPTRTASGEGPEYIRFSVQVTQSSGSQASVPQTSSSAHGGNGGQDACDSATTVQFDDAVLTSLDMNRAASPLNAKTRSRFLSFAGWPRNSGLSPTVLAEAGFYYLGSGDSVRCWYCGIILRNWRQSDDPWVTHVLFRFSCDFVLAVRGQNFITQALIRRGHASNTQRENGSARFAGPTNGQSGSQAPRSANGTPEEQVRYGISGESPTTHLSATTSQRQPSCQDTANGTSSNTFNVDDASNKVSGVNTQDNRRTSAASPAAPNTTRSSEPDSANGRPGVQSTVVTNGRGRLDGAENERSSRDSRERRSTPDPSSVAGRGNAVSRGPGLSTDAAMSSTSNSRPAAGSSSSRPSSAAGASNTGRSASSSRNSSASEPSSGASPSTKSGSASGRNNVGEKRKSKSNKGSKKGTGNGDTSASKKTGAANVTPGQHAPQQELQTDAVPIAGDAAHARRHKLLLLQLMQSHNQKPVHVGRRCGTVLPASHARQPAPPRCDVQLARVWPGENVPLTTIFLPCGHLCTCDTCSATIRECCLCYQRIRGTAHVYME